MREFYMLHDDVWEAILPEEDLDKMLCIGCAEFRFQQEFRSYDFLDCPLNVHVIGHSDRLRSRLVSYM